MKYRAPRFLFRRHEIFRHIEGGTTFIEVGAGNLLLSEELVKFFDRGVAVDFTDDLKISYSKLAGEIRSRLEILNLDFVTQSVPGKFDCFIACEVMEHIDDDAAFLRKIRDVLKPGGQAIISVPARVKYWSVHDELVGHVRRYEKAELIEKTTGAGFSSVRVISYGFPWVNILSLPRIWLARRSISDRKDWDQQRQTSMSNHNQIPSWLSNSILPFFVNRFTIYPFARFSQLFNASDRSNGYVIIMFKEPADA
ncbi:MAG: methyltransferase domain-containing protein [Woeseia sp.]